MEPDWLPGLTGIRIVVPYELAAQLMLLFFGIEVPTMTVWRAVQRLGEAAEKYTEEQTRFFGDPHGNAIGNEDGPSAVVLGVDGCALGMQVRPKRRRRKGNEVLPALPPDRTRRRILSDGRMMCVGQVRGGGFGRSDQPEGPADRALFHAAGNIAGTSRARTTPSRASRGRTSARYSTGFTSARWQLPRIE